MLARILIRDCFDRDSRQAGPVKTENVGRAIRDIDDSAFDERSPITDHQHRRAVVGEIGPPGHGFRAAANDARRSCGRERGSKKRCLSSFEPARHSKRQETQVLL
jgi:hypothetical protein